MDRDWATFGPRQTLDKVKRAWQKNGSQVARILFLLLLTTSAWPCLNNFRNLGSILMLGPVDVGLPVTKLLAFLWLIPPNSQISGPLDMPMDFQRHMLHSDLVPVTMVRSENIVIRLPVTNIPYIPFLCSFFSSFCPLLNNVLRRRRR